MTVAIIDYGSGNLRSALQAFERVAPAKSVVVTRDPTDLAKATHIVLPGVGAFGDCMRGLASLEGMLDFLSEQVLVQKKPFLGVCVGMQLLFECGHEYGVHAGLGWLSGEVAALRTTGAALKIPHMGWNELEINTEHPLLAGLKTGDHAYFVHSYHAVCTSAADVIATTQYGQTITAVVARGNIMGAQFHPEKSQQAGLTLLRNFISL